MNSQHPHMMTLAAAASRVLETAAFAFAEVADEEEAPVPDSGCLARLTLSGDLPGELVVAASEELCRLLAADIVGTEPEETSRQQAADMLGELANIIAGQLATDLLGEEAIVPLNPPVSEFLSAREWDTWSRRPTSLMLLVDEQPLLLDLQLQYSTDRAVQVTEQH